MLICKLHTDRLHVGYMYRPYKHIDIRFFYIGTKYYQKECVIITLNNLYLSPTSSDCWRQVEAQGSGQRRLLPSGFWFTTWLAQVLVYGNLTVLTPRGEFGVRKNLRQCKYMPFGILSRNKK